MCSKLLSKRNSLCLSTLSVYQQSLSQLSKQNSLWQLFVSRKLLSEKTKPKISLLKRNQSGYKKDGKKSSFSILILPDSIVMFHQQSSRYISGERHTYRFRTAWTRWLRSMDPPKTFRWSCDARGRCLANEFTIKTGIYTENFRVSLPEPKRLRATSVLLRSAKDSDRPIPISDSIDVSKRIIWNWLTWVRFLFQWRGKCVRGWCHITKAFMKVFKAYFPWNLINFQLLV